MTTLQGLLEQEAEKIKAEPTAQEPARPDQTADTNGDGEISPDELFKYFDTNGDGKITMTDYAAHILFHIMNPDGIKPYLTQAQGQMEGYNESVSRLHKRLEETLMVSDKDPQKDIKVKNALTKNQDVDVVDSTKINQLRLKEEFDTTRYKYLAGL